MQPAVSKPEFPLPQVPTIRRFKSLRVIAALMLRELESSDSRTSLGFLWAFIDPIATITLMSVVFGVISRSPPIGDNFPLFYLTGIVPFGLYAALASKSAGALRFSRSLLSFPSVKPIDAIMARFLLNFFIEIIVFLVLTFVIIYFWSLNPHIKPLLVIQSLLLAAALGLGLGCFNAVLFLLVPTYDNLWSIVTRPIMLASGVLIPIDSIPEPYATWLWWNPILHGVGAVRGGFYDVYDAYYVSPAYVLFVAMSCLTLGLLFLRAHHREILSNN